MSTDFASTSTRSASILKRILTFYTNCTPALARLKKTPGNHKESGTFIALKISEEEVKLDLRKII